MRKEEFFNLLKKRLDVIEKDELDDILSEYRQHIEMKISSGIDEEEAIKDFGDIDELADDILEAYHVRRDYKKNDSKIEEAKEKGENLFKKLLSRIKEFFICIFLFFKNLFKGFFEGIKRMFSKIAKPFKKKDDSCNVKEKGKVMSKIKRGGAGFLAFLKNLFITFVVFMRNVFCGIFGIISGLLALLFLFSLGTSAVFLFKGYPLAGIIITLLGITLSFISLTLLSWGFIKKKEKYKENKEAEANV